jgi:hypothetical protein
MNKYEEIDDILKNFAKIHNLTFYTRYQEEEIRSFDIGDSKGRNYQLWVDAPDEKGQISIHAWDYKKKRSDFIADVSNLLDSLEVAYRTINKWMVE